MKTKLYIFCLLVLCGLLNSCDKEIIRASHDISTTEYSFSNYTGLKISSAFNAYVTFSDSEEEIIVKANNNIQKYISVSKDGDKLIVKLDNDVVLRGDSTLDVFIKTRHIENYELSGAATVTLENDLVATNVDIRLSGASKFYGDLEIDRLDYDAHGASESNFFGVVKDFNAQLNGASELRGYDLLATQLDIRLSGASEAWLSVSELIDIDASGASTLRYKGEATIGKLKLSGASEVIKKD